MSAHLAVHVRLSLTQNSSKSIFLCIVIVLLVKSNPSTSIAIRIHTTRVTTAGLCLKNLFFNEHNVSSVVRQDSGTLCILCLRWLPGLGHAVYLMFALVARTLARCRC